jgi:hypothetical protein
LNDFPHSKQNGLDRGVINPQKGHILEGPTSPRDVLVDKSFSSESVRKLRKLRRWTRKECKTEPTLSRFRQAHDDTSRAAILCKIAQLSQELSVRKVTVKPILGLGCKIQSEQFRSAIVSSLGDHKARDEHFFSLFQVL